jgi:tetratricopeptide (TPR) repeat protein
VEGGILFAVAAGGLVFAQARQPPIVSLAGEQRPRETKDRVPPEQMQDMVAGPLALLRAGRAAEADAAARRLVDAAEARGDKVRVADLLTSYGVQRYSEGDADLGQDTRSTALPWLREAVAAARRAWGPDHAETALALNDLADVLREIAPDAPGIEAEQALRQAYGIRLRALGPANAETLTTASVLADVLAAGPPAASLAPGRDIEVSALYLGAAKGLATPGSGVPARERLAPLMGLARVEARRGRPAEAVAYYERARQALLQPEADGRPDLSGCLGLLADSQQLAAILKAHGAPQAAERVRGGSGADRLQACFEGRP